MAEDLKLTGEILALAYELCIEATCKQTCALYQYQSLRLAAHHPDLKCSLAMHISLVAD